MTSIITTFMSSAYLSWGWSVSPSWAPTTPVRAVSPTHLSKGESSSTPVPPPVAVTLRRWLWAENLPLQIRPLLFHPCVCTARTPRHLQPQTHAPTHFFFSSYWSLLTGYQRESPSASPLHSPESPTRTLWNVFSFLCSCLCYTHRVQAETEGLAYFRKENKSSVALLVPVNCQLKNAAQPTVYIATGGLCL